MPSNPVLTLILSLSHNILIVLQSIYGDEAIRLWRPSADHSINPPVHKDTVRYEAKLR
jgi:hypothetical protein